MKYILIVPLILGYLFVCGCALQAPHLEANYGTAYNLAKNGQILDLEAEKRNLNKPVCGLDGQAALAAMEKYRKSFEKESQAPSYTLKIGDISNIR